MELDRLHGSANDLPAEVRGRLEQLVNQAGEIAADTQSLSHELHSARLDYLGITAAVKGLSVLANGNTWRSISKAIMYPVPCRRTFLSLFRVLQEALHNSAKHSGAKRFIVRLWGKPDEIWLSVSDSGTGFDSEAVKENLGAWPCQHGGASGAGEWQSLYRIAAESGHHNLRSCSAQSCPAHAGHRVDLAAPNSIHQARASYGKITTKQQIIDITLEMGES